MPCVASLAPSPYVAASTVAQMMLREGIPPATPGFHVVDASGGRIPPDPAAALLEECDDDDDVPAALAPDDDDAADVDAALAPNDDDAAAAELLCVDSSLLVDVVVEAVVQAETIAVAM